MRILYAASECTPFFSSGGLGEVIGSLPGAVSRLENQDIDIILPLYASLDIKYRKRMKPLYKLQFYLSWRKTEATVYIYRMKKINYYFIDNPYYFGREKLYGEYDDAERFAYFCRAVIEFLKFTPTPPDIIHANDWQTAPLVIYLKRTFADDARLKEIKTLFTVHNIEYQGSFTPTILSDVFGLEEKDRGIVEYNGAINLLKGALICADYINTVSPSYANELKYD